VVTVIRTLDIHRTIYSSNGWGRKISVEGSFEVEENFDKVQFVDQLTETFWETFGFGFLIIEFNDESGNHFRGIAAREKYFNQKRDQYHA
jgi:hypothetical protein